MSNMDGVGYDPYEYAEQLKETQELTRGDFTEPAAPSGLTRRNLLVKGGVGVAALGGLGAVAGKAAAAPAKAGKFTGTLRVITLGVEWPPGAKEQAEKDLGFKFNIQAMGTNQQVQKSITDPESFDVGGLYNYQFFQIWPTGNFTPVDTRKLKAWNSMYPLFARGKVNPNNKAATYGQGNAPFRSLFLDPNGTLGLPPAKSGPKSNKAIVEWIDERTGKPIGGKPMPRYITAAPAHFNFDSMGYNGDILKKAPGQVSWAELLNAKWQGRVALLNDPGIISQDGGNAVQALGLMKFKNVGNMTKGEIDRFIKIMIGYKKKGQFRAFWGTFNESVNLMASKEVVIESMWSPAVALLVAQGVNCRYAFPKEGMRGWCGTQGIPAHVAKDPAKLQAVYDYMNWMNEGYLGAAIMRQGYYISNGNQLPAWLKSARAKTTGKPPFTQAEHDFWYSGKPAARNLPGITGQVGDIKKGSVRDGGSFVKRSTKIASWNSFFTENVHQIKRVNEFLSA